MKSLRDEIRTDVRDKEDGFNFICRHSDRFHPTQQRWISSRLSVGVPGESRTAIRGERTPRFHFLLFQAFMFIAEYQTQQIQYLYAFFAFAISGVKHRKILASARIFQ
jgi:hypothetical protein